MGSNRNKKKLDKLIKTHTKSAQDKLVNEEVDVEINFNVDNKMKSRASNLLKSHLNQSSKSKPSKLLLEELLSIEVNLVDEKEANNPNVRQDFISGDYLKFSSKLDLKIPSDKQNILQYPQDCLEILNALASLARIVLGLEFDHEKHFYIGDRLQCYNSSANNISREKILLEIKLKTLYLITKTARIANEFLIKPQFSLEEFSQLVKSTRKEADLIKVTAINLTDLSEILEDISQVFPEFKLPEKWLKPNFEAKLFSKNNLEPTPSCAIVDTAYAVMVGKGLFFDQVDKELVAKKTYSTGIVELIIKEIGNTIIEDFGEDTFAVFITLLTYAQRNKSSLSEFISVNGEDILELLNKKNARDNKGNRIGKDKNLSWLTKHCELIRKLDVYIGEWFIKKKGKKKDTFHIEQTPLINFDKIKIEGQLNIYGKIDKSAVYYLHIKYKIGAWAEYFCGYNDNYLDQFGYVHEDVLGLNSRKNLGKRIGLSLPVKLRQTENGQFKIRTLLDHVGEGETLQQIFTENDSNKKATSQKNLKEEFEFAIKQLTSFEHPYQIEYKDPPSWLINSKERKPRGCWFDIWLDTVVLIKNPLCLTAVANEVKDLLPQRIENKLTVEDLKQAMGKHDIKIRPLAKIYGSSYSWLQRRLKSGKFKKHELEDLLKQVELLSKKSKK